MRRLWFGVQLGFIAARRAPRTLSVHPDRLVRMRAPPSLPVMLERIANDVSVPRFLPPTGRAPASGHGRGLRRDGRGITRRLTG